LCCVQCGDGRQQREGRDRDACVLLDECLRPQVHNDRGDRQGQDPERLKGDAMRAQE
jgi:hypothetical protein